MHNNDEPGVETKPSIPPKDDPQLDGAEGLRDEVVNQSYDAAFEPSRLPDLLGPWDRFFSPQWRMSPQNRLASVEGSGLLVHLGRLDRILGLGARTPKASEEEQAVNRYRQSAAFAINGNLTVTAANEAASCMLGVEAQLPLSALQVHEADLDHLARVAKGMLSGTCPRTTEPMRNIRARRLSDDSLVLLLAYLIEPESGAPFVLVATTEILWPPGATQLLRDAFGLTEAEAEIMMALTQHHSLTDIAASRGRSVATVRSQIKAIQAKTEARGQSDLLRIAMSVMDIAPGDGDRIGPAPTPANTRLSRGAGGLPALPFHELERPDGRRFDYLEYGDPKGRAVIYLSSTFGLCRWPVDAEKRARRDGVRIIAPIRAGFGGSTPYPDKERRTDRYAEDVLALMDHLGIGTAQVMVMDADMPYAARLFAVAPERVEAVLGCSTILPLTTPQQYERMGRWHRFILGTARYAPQLLTFVVRVAFAMARQLGKDEFVRLVYGGSAVDVAMTRNAELFAPVDCGSDVVLGQGFDAAAAYVQELNVFHRTEWRADLDAMLDQIPVTVMIGAQDQSMPAETLAEFHLDHPRIRFVCVKEAGSFLFFQKWDAVLDELGHHSKHRT